MKPPAVVRAATRQTGNRTFDSPDARKIEKTIRTFVNEPPRPCPSREGEIVATFFVADAQILTRFAPFLSVRKDASTSSAKLGEKMREFMT